MEEAASIPLVGLTAWQALIERAGLRQGQKVSDPRRLRRAWAPSPSSWPNTSARPLATTASAANADLVRRLGADIVIDYRKDDFARTSEDFDVVLDTQGGAVLEKSLQVLKPGGKVIGIAGPPDPDLRDPSDRTRSPGWGCASWSRRIRKEARRRHVGYSFLFMRADGDQLREIAALIDSGLIRPVVDRVFPFEATKEALATMSKPAGRRARS